MAGLLLFCCSRFPHVILFYFKPQKSMFLVWGWHIITSCQTGFWTLVNVKTQWSRGSCKPLHKKHPPHSNEYVQLVSPSVYSCTVNTGTEHGPTCSCLSSQRSTMGWLALSDERAVSLWNSLWLAHVPASLGRLRYVSMALPCKDTEIKVLDSHV